MPKRNLRLTLWSDINFSGRRIRFRRGAVAVRDLDAFRFNNMLSSFRVANTCHSEEVTLVLFSRKNFQGSFRVYRGNTSRANLSNNSFNNLTSSFILSQFRLTDSEIIEIRRTGNPPGDTLIISQ